LAGFTGSTGQRVPPPGTGTYAAPDRYYRGPESVSAPNDSSASQIASAPVGAAPIGSGVVPAAYSAPSQYPVQNFSPMDTESRAAPSQNPGATELRAKLRGMPAVELSNQAAPPAMIRGQDQPSAADFQPKSSGTVAKSDSKPTSNANRSTAANAAPSAPLNWQAPSRY
jgi:hypothetical protein